MTANISVVIPVYNVEKYLRRCVDSVINQTYSSLEIILVDDGSPDQCPVICDEYAEQDKRIKVIHKTNGGLASARNAGMKVATGKYLFFVDSDDWLDPDGLQLLYDAAEKDNVDFVRYRAIRTGWPGKEENTPGTLEPIRELKPGYYEKKRILHEVYPRLLATSELTMGSIVGAWEALYNRNFLIRNNLWFYEEVKYGEDQIFSACVVRAASSFVYIETPCVYHYCYNLSSISRSFRQDRWNSCKETIRLAKKDFSHDTEYDFSLQLNWLIWFCILLALNERKYISSYKKRVAYCKSILFDPIIKEYHLQMRGIQVSIKQRIILYLIKFKAASIIARIK